MENIKAILVIVAGVATAISMNSGQQGSGLQTEYKKHDVVRDAGGKSVIGNNEKIRPQ